MAILFFFMFVILVALKLPNLTSLVYPKNLNNWMVSLDFPLLVGSRILSFFFSFFFFVFCLRGGKGAMFLLCFLPCF